MTRRKGVEKTTIGFRATTPTRETLTADAEAKGLTIGGYLAWLAEGLANRSLAIRSTKTVKKSTTKSKDSK